MNTRAPRDCSTATAMGRPPNREDNIVTHDSTASGVCLISPCSRTAESFGCSAQTCFRSAQSMATKAANAGCEKKDPSLILADLTVCQALCFREKLIVESWLFRTASEYLVQETKQFPLLEPLSENIECSGIELVAAGRLLTDHCLTDSKSRRRLRRGSLQC